MRKILFTFVITIQMVAFNSTVWAQTNLTEAVDFTVTDIEGEEHQLFDILDNQHKYVLIDFFFTTCAPCQGTAPKVNAAYEYFGCNSADVVFLGIDSGDTDAQCAAFDEQFGVHYPTISGKQGGGNAVCGAYHISSFPTIILITPNHDIVIQDIWPVNTPQVIINKLEPYGIEAHECNDAIEEASTLNTFEVYPNPSTGLFNVQSSQLDDYTVQVYDVAGRKVHESQLFAHQTQVDLSALQKGMYILQLSTDAIVYTKNVVIR